MRKISRPFLYENGGELYRIHTKSLHFTKDVPLKELLESLAMTPDRHAFVTRECANNWPFIFKRLCVFSSDGDQWEEYSPEKLRGWTYYDGYKWDFIDWVGLWREFQYFFEWFHDTYFPTPKMAPGTFFESFCLKLGKRYSAQQAANGIHKAKPLMPAERARLDNIFSVFE